MEEWCSLRHYEDSGTTRHERGASAAASGPAGECGVPHLRYDLTGPVHPALPGVAALEADQDDVKQVGDQAVLQRCEPLEPREGAGGR